MTQTAAQQARSRTLLIAATAIAAPLAFTLETFIRTTFFPNAFSEIREVLGAYFTDAAWLLVGLTLIAAVGGVFAQSRLLLRAREKAQHGIDPQLGAFFLAATIPQLPAILATVASMFGAATMPVLLTLAISTLGVLLQATRMRTEVSVS